MVQQRPVGRCDELDRGLPQGRPVGRREDDRFHRRRPGIRAEPRQRREGDREDARLENRLRAELSANDRGLLLDDPRDTRCQAGHGVRDVYPNDSVAIVRAVNEIGVGDSVKLFGGGMVGLQFTPIMESLGSLLNGIINYTCYVPEKTMESPGIKDFLDALLQRQPRSRPARRSSAAFQLRHRADPGAGGRRDQEPRSQGAGGLPAQERVQDDRGTDQLGGRRRALEARRADDPVPRRRRQERRPVPAGGQAGRAASSETPRRRTDHALGQGAQVAAATIPGRRGGPAPSFFSAGRKPVLVRAAAGRAIVLGLLLGCFFLCRGEPRAVGLGVRPARRAPHRASRVPRAGGLYGTYVLNRNGWDPILAGIALMPVFFLIGERSTASTTRPSRSAARRRGCAGARVLFRYRVALRSAEQHELNE